MEADALPRERGLYPTYNLFESWRVARCLRTEKPLALVMVTGAIPFEELPAPSLKPGELLFGPVYWGFCLPEVRPGEAALGDPQTESRLFRLLLSSSADQLWEAASETERDGLVLTLSRLADTTDLDPWLLVGPLSRIGRYLPPGLRARLAKRLPQAVSEVVARLAEARASLEGGAGMPDPVRALARRFQGQRMPAQSERRLSAIIHRSNLYLHGRR